MEILSHPFRLRHNGTVATVEQGSDQATAEHLAVLLLTRLGERELVPGFGTTDPTFRGFDPSEIYAGVAAFGPPVAIEDIAVDVLADDTFEVTIGFS